MKWRIKGIVQKVLGVLPAGEELHYLLQRRYGGLRDVGAECDIKVDDWRFMVNHLQVVGITIAGA